MVIVKRGHKIIDIEYLSDKFGLVEMDITNVETPPTKETSEYLEKLKRNRDKEQVIDNCNNRQ
jgi:hypothetical protein